MRSLNVMQEVVGSILLWQPFKVMKSFQQGLLVVFYNFIIGITIFRWLLFYRLLFTWSVQEQYSTIPICCPIIENPSRNVWKICLQWSGVHLACCAVMVNACKPSVQSSVIIHVTYTRGSCGSQFLGSRFAETLDVSLLLYQITPFVFLVTFTLHLQDKRQATVQQQLWFQQANVAS